MVSTMTDVTIASKCAQPMLIRPNAARDSLSGNSTTPNNSFADAGMAKPPPTKPRHPDPTEVDPKRGDQLLKRLLHTKPKPHDEMVAERKAARRDKPANRKPRRDAGR